jgi:hypothetical protein
MVFVARAVPVISPAISLSCSGAPIINAVAALIQQAKAAVELRRLMGGVYTSGRLTYAKSDAQQVAAFAKHTVSACIRALTDSSWVERNTAKRESPAMTSTCAFIAHTIDPSRVQMSRSS